MSSTARSNNLRRPWRILVAEDDKEMRRVVADVLRKESYDVEELYDGKELLLRVVGTNPPRHFDTRFDLLVSDVRMPFCSGLDVLERLRIERCPTPVLLMTAFGDRGLRNRVNALGATLLDKPFTPRALRETVREILASHPMH